MAGITDWPFRETARRTGAGLCIAEMLSAQTALWNSRKSATRLPSLLDPAPRPVQLAGSDPDMLATAAARCAAMGAQWIDINMGCPAKKVCNRAAGSALLADEGLVRRILHAVVAAVDVPVTLKMRTGPSPQQRNAVRIAQIAEQAGIAALSIHGRTRACRFRGHAEYRTIAQVVRAVRIPVIANGDIRSPEQARRVLRATGAAAVMVGRGAQGRPWLLRQISDYLQTGRYREPSNSAKLAAMRAHLRRLYRYYGTERGPQLARKQIGWYLQAANSNRNPDLSTDRCRAAQQEINQITAADAQMEAASRHFAALTGPECEMQHPA
ncbi:MAG: tRNA dihydrouridine synthase DusB [Cellvibrionales bacterium]|nr:tRNA dihydrouridine synthase DusB [Cellvibrionales bacterium]